MQKSFPSGFDAYAPGCRRPMGMAHLRKDIETLPSLAMSLHLRAGSGRFTSDHVYQIMSF